MLRPRAGERVDRLVVVADDAEVVAVTEPVLEQCLLQEVDVLVLVDCERAILRAKGQGGARIALEQAHRPFEQILEVDKAPVLLLQPLVVAVHARHQVGRDRRLAVGRGLEVGVRSDAPVLRPLDLGREVSRGAELVRSAQPIAELPEKQCLRRQDAADVVGREVA